MNGRLFYIFKLPTQRKAPSRYDNRARHDSPRVEFAKRAALFTEWFGKVAERSDRALFVVVAVCPEAVDAAGADATSLHAFQLPLVSSAVSITHQKDKNESVRFCLVW